VAGLFYHDVRSALAGAGVRHVIVGGVAVNLQGVPRFTADIDLAVASVGTLIRMKTGTGRKQDASDVEALRRIQEASRAG
jgi:hypothetical protein